MGGCKERLWNSLIRVCRNHRLLRFKDKRFHDDHVRAAAQAIVARVLWLAFVLRMRYGAVGVRQKIAGKNLHARKEHEKYRREAKRLGPKPHLSLSCHSRMSRSLASRKSLGIRRIVMLGGDGCPTSPVPTIAEYVA